MILDKSYNTVNYGRVASFSGAELCRRDGKLILRRGYGPDGNALSITRKGYIEEVKVKTVKDITVFPCSWAHTWGWRARIVLVLEDGSTVTIQSRDGHDGGEISPTAAEAIGRLLPTDLKPVRYESGVGYIVE